ncbi:SDR family NAD(P)-dependent oxidoreductase [Serratia fonticola]|uniref:SDR family NAD(P)-dependent oxidoreductase n=1 Tax=Serratia fonticola TaxID=47917 RepID=UPI0024DEDC86|nr:SDR family NAD(P)-dependent oxidoreductase [Serratia fonticola]MDK2374519.1 SDR family NAD(P)-dependent oxidoreductase [Serratia fonticola]
MKNVNQGMGTFLLEPLWTEQALLPAPSAAQAFRNDDLWLVLCDVEMAPDVSLDERYSPDRCVQLSADGDVARRYVACVLQLLELLRDRIAHTLARSVRLQLVVTDKGEASVMQGLGAMLRSVQREHPGLRGQLVVLDDAGWINSAQRVDMLRHEADTAAESVRFAGETRQVLHWAPIRADDVIAEDALPWRDHGVYWITGGLGGLGRRLAQSACAVKQPVLVLSGRTVDGEEQQQFAETLRAQGATVELHGLDICDAQAAGELAQGIIARHGRLNGVIHCAGVLHDRLLSSMSAAEAQQVLAPKVSGLMAIDLATRNIALEWLIACSSITAIVGNLGQSSYAAANGFMDYFAVLRQAGVEKGERHGRTLSLNWPLLSGGGMQPDEATRFYLRRNGLMVTLPLEQEPWVMTRALCYPAAHLAVWHGDENKLTQWLAGGASPMRPEPVRPRAVSNDDAQQESMVRYLKKCLSGTLNLDVSRIDEYAPLEKYGIDSVMAVTLIRDLESVFGPLPVTLFFEYQTIAELTQYFITHHKEAFQALPDVGQPASRQNDVDRGLPSTGSLRRPQRSGGWPSPAPLVVPGGAEGALDIAIIGLSGRYPGAANLEQFWHNLQGGVDSITTLPSWRWEWQRYFHQLPEQKQAAYSSWGGFIDGVDEFDPLFFNLSPRDAQYIDPQERLFLQCAWHAVEDAGYSRRTLGAEGNTTGVFVGVMYEEYQLYGAQAQARGEEMVLSGSAASIANRVSYFCNFHGPSLAVDTMCSSSLTAIHLACHSLRRGECSVAVAGGVNVSVHPNKYILLAHGQFASGSGRCQSFGEGGDGYVPGEGVGAAVLKPLHQAVADGDHIYGVIKGSALNHGGKVNGFTVPNPKLQGQAIRRALRESGVAAEAVSYVEAHGTGTALGDPIEIRALSQAFDSDKRQYCAIGSVKSNIGHCESAAGMAGLSKILLQMQHGQLVKSLHSATLNPHIDFSQTPFVVQQQSAPWLRLQLAVNGRMRELPRVAGLSSFGAGGVNAHLIIEEYRGESIETPVAGPQLIVLSARTQERLWMQAEQLLGFLAEHQVNLADLAWTLQTGREAMNCRLALVVDSLAGLVEQLRVAVGAPQTEHDPDELIAFADKHERDETIRRWIAAEDLQTLARQWALGVEIDWLWLWPEHKPQRLSLPVYPFARERCWVPGVSVAPVAAGSAEIALGTEEIAVSRLSVPRYDPVFFTEEWQVQPFESVVSPAIRHILCLPGDDVSLAEIRQFFAGVAAEIGVSFILNGSAGNVPEGGDVYYAGSGSVDGYLNALRRVAERGADIDVLLDLRSLTDEGKDDLSGMFHLLKALNLSAIPCRRLLWAGHGATDVAQAYLEARIGLVRSLKFSFPAMVAVSVGERAQQRSGLAIWLERLWGELAEDSLRDVMYLDGIRHICEVAPITPRVPEVEEPPFRNGGTYWITGGWSGIGAQTAHYLATHYRVNLVLSGRSAPDAARQQLITQLSANNASALYVQADVTDRAAMAAAYHQVKARFGQVDGVIHVAGLSEQADLLTTTDEQFRQILATKTVGVEILNEILCDEPLHLACYFGSLSASIGDFGSGAYAAANRFMMAWARLCQQAQPQKRIITLGWPLWHDGGMNEKNADLIEQYLVASGQGALETGDGMRLLEQMLRMDNQTQPLITLGDAPRMAHLLQQSLTRQAVQEPRADVTDVQPGQNAGRGYHPEMAGLSLNACIAWDLQQQVHLLLGIRREELDPNANLAEYGFDSIRLVEITQKVNEYYGFSLSPSVFFNYPTLGRLADYLEEEYQPLMAEFYQAPGQLAGESAASTLSEAEVPSAQTSSSVPAAMDDPIAIIGISGRFPQARDAEALWDILAQERCVVQPYPPERLPADGRWDEAAKYRMGSMPGVDEFDPLFFEISPREAAIMDPRQRLLLQEAWRALEDAGYGPEQLQQHHIGMFVGVEQGDYAQLFSEMPDVGALTAGHNGVLASRLAYMLDLHGPTMAINTACSSGLVALHQACQSLRTQECDTAIAAGVSMMATPMAIGLMAMSGMSSPDGICYAFDQRANGMVPGEACVALVLKRLSQARMDGDPIHAVIAGSGINYDGKTQGITAPSGTAQTRLLQNIYQRYRIAPDRFDYIVTHGTGTPLGDPIEINALNEAFKPYSARRGFCALTSSKPNLGHALAASGLVSLVALVQALRHETIPASLNCEQESQYIEWQNSPFYVNKQARSWPIKAASVRQGAVSAFGMSGTNAHVVVQGAELVATSATPVTPPLPYHLLVLSAKTAEALRQSLGQLSALLQTKTWQASELQAMSHTLLNGRHHFTHRCALVVQDGDEAASVLELTLQGEAPANLLQGHTRRDFRPQKTLQTYGETLLAGINVPREAVSLREALLTLGDMYCQGYVLPWPTMFGSQPPRRLHLPSYPFARDRYWVKAQLSDGAQSELPAIRLPAALGAVAAANTTPPAIAPRVTLMPAPEQEQTPIDGADKVIVFERHLTLLAWAQIGSLGWLADETKVTPAFRRWYQATLAMLQERGIDLSVAPPDWQTQWGEWAAAREALAAIPVLTAQVKLMEPLLLSLAAILRGEKQTTEVLFAKEQMALLENVYRNNPVADRFNGVLAERFATYVQARVAQAPQVRLRILEIGAGTGGTSGLIFDQLAPWAANIEEYTYTDISDFFLHYGQKNYLAQAPYLRTRKLNIENAPEEQGIAVESYDIVIAANVLHATRDVRVSLHNSRSLLKPNGLLLLNEIASANMFTHLSFALLDGWWLFEDEALRLPGTPALTPSTWQQILQEGGWRSVEFPAAAIHSWGQQIVLAFRKDEALKQNDIALDYPEAQDDGQVRQIGLELAAMVAEQLMLPVESLDFDAPLAEFGVNSLILMSFSEKLSARFGLTLTPAVFFETPTLSALAAYLAKASGSIQEQPASVRVVSPTNAGNASMGAEAKPTVNDEPVAIIGISAHFARSPDIGALWQKLQTGEDCIEEVPPERWSLEGFYTPNREEAIAQGLSYSKWGGFVREDELVMSPTGKDAQRLAPAQALFVEAVQNAIESAGYDAAALAQRSGLPVGVYVGEVSDVGDRQTLRSPTAVAATSCIVSNLFGFTGPSLSVNAHSASSLAAVHTACLSLARGECGVAIAGGVSWFDEQAWRLLCRFNLMGTRMDSRSFSETRDGMLFADGAGAVVLKPLSAAQRDGDNVIALIRSTVTGFVEPLGEHGNPVNKLAELMRENFRRSSIDPRTIGYVDAAAAGLPAGDALEFAAMSRAFDSYTADRQFCALGAVQSNIGHAGAASGISQLAKVVLQLQHGQLAPGFCRGSTLDKALDLPQSPFWTPLELTPWEMPGVDVQEGEKVPLRAMINSQGYGGFYAGAIIEGVAPPQDEAEPEEQATQLMVLAAADEEGLLAELRRLLRFITTHRNLRLADVAYTLQTGRVAGSYRWAVTTDNQAALAQTLRRFLDDPVATHDGVMSGVVEPGGSVFDGLLDDEAKRMILQRYAADGDLCRLANWWIKGAEIEWGVLHVGTRVRRVWLRSERRDKEA